MLWLIAIACAIGAAWQAKYHRLAAVTMVGVCGLMTCVTFVWFSAPDLALTQLAVEVVTTVLILLGLRWLPRRNENVAPPTRSRNRARVRRVRDFVLAVGVGGGMALLSYAMLTRPTPNAISEFYLSRALTQGGGTNTVNVMLVDFRGFDTFGEITVLAVVALTVFALLRRFRPPKESILLPAQQRLLARDVVTDLVNPRHALDTALGFMMVPAVLVRLLLPVAFVVSMYLFMRGHNQPGGGFVAGLVMSVAFILQYMVAGTQWVEANMSLRPLRWMGTGLFFALATGLGSMALGYPFMTTHTAHLHLPLLGDVHVASALFFDIGVYAVVVGSTLLILTALAHQSVRSHRPTSLPQPIEPASPPTSQGAI
jgi:multicomponent K+:H+ antiporter subunit A